MPNTPPRAWAGDCRVSGVHENEPRGGGRRRRVWCGYRYCVACHTGQGRDEGAIFVQISPGDDARVTVGGTGTAWKVQAPYNAYVFCLSHSRKQLGFLSGLTIRPGSKCGLFHVSEQGPREANIAGSPTGSCHPPGANPTHRTPGELPRTARLSGTLWSLGSFLARRHLALLSKVQVDGTQCEVRTSLHACSRSAGCPRISLAQPSQISGTDSAISLKFSNVQYVIDGSSTST